MISLWSWRLKAGWNKTIFSEGAPGWLILRLNPWPRLFGCIFYRIFKLEVSRSHRTGIIGSQSHRYVHPWRLTAGTHGTCWTYSWRFGEIMFLSVHGWFVFAGSMLTFQGVYHDISIKLALEKANQFDSIHAVVMKSTHQPGVAKSNFLMTIFKWEDITYILFGSQKLTSLAVKE